MTHQTVIVIACDLQRSFRLLETLKGQVPKIHHMTYITHLHRRKVIRELLIIFEWNNCLR